MADRLPCGLVGLTRGAGLFIAIRGRVRELGSSKQRVGRLECDLSIMDQEA